MRSRRLRLASLSVLCLVYLLGAPQSGEAAEACGTQIVVRDGPCEVLDPFFVCADMFPDCGGPVEGFCYTYNPGQDTAWNNLVCTFAG